MYVAKQSGRNQIRFHTDAMNGKTAQRTLFETELTDALDRGEFTILAQPVRELATSRLVRAELRLHWARLSAEAAHDDFYPIVERCGLTTRTERWMLAQVHFPRQTGHRFHGKPATRSSPNWTAIPPQTGQFEAA